MKEQHLTFSICIPTYNRSTLLERAIRSVIAQLSPSDELIIQDNASTDNTQEIVIKYLVDKRIRYFRNKKNIGLTLNFGEVLNNATKDFIYLLTDDDYLLPDALDNCRNFAIASGVKAFKTSYFNYNVKSNTGKLNSEFHTNVLPSGISLNDVARIYHSSHTFSGFCLRKRLFNMQILKDNKDIWYPSMLFMGLAGTDVGYLNIPTNMHIWENETFWGIDPSRRDLLNNSQIDVLIFLYNNGYFNDELLEHVVSEHLARYEDADNSRIEELVSAAVVRKGKKMARKRKMEILMKSFGAKFLSFLS